MDLVPILATVVLIATLSTLVLGVLSYYLAFRAHDERRPRDTPEPAPKVFLVRLGLPESSGRTSATAS